MNIYTLLDTGRNLNIHKTLKRRLGRLLNILCTSNLRHVSREIMSVMPASNYCATFLKVSLNAVKNFSAEACLGPCQTPMIEFFWENC